MQFFNERAKGLEVHDPLVDPDLILVGDGDNDACLVLLIAGNRFRLLHGDTRLFYEGGRHDEEDQHDEDDVEHRRHVDLELFFLLLIVTHLVSSHRTHLHGRQTAPTLPSDCPLTVKCPSPLAHI